jgi:hypothetical protein
MQVTYVFRGMLLSHDTFLSQVHPAFSHPPFLFRVAVSCLCGILDAVPHFNYISDVLQVLVPKLDSSDDRIRCMTAASLKLLLRRGSHGEVMLEAVQLIADLVRKGKCKCHPDGVRVLMALEFQNISREDVSQGTSVSSIATSLSSQPLAEFAGTLC